MKDVVKNISAFLSSLSMPVSIFDAEGKALFGTLSLPASLTLSCGQFRRENGFLFLKTRLKEDIIIAVKDGEHAEDMARTMDALMQSLAFPASHKDDRELALFKLISDPLSEEESKLLARQAGILFASRRCVFYICLHKTLVGRRSLKHILPLEENDLVLKLDDACFVFVKYIGKHDGESLSEYGNAISETLLSEEGIYSTIGVGSVADDASQMHISFEDAKNAVSVGRAFYPKRQVFDHFSLLSERTLLCIPRQVAAEQVQAIFSKENAHFFNEEMMETIDMLFSNNLNLSEAARLLYLHRNTLIYRLDKIKKQTGLDLRRFDDAFSFKLLYQLKRLL